MKQVDSERSKLRLLGPAWTVLQTTMGLFSLFVMAITVFGFYSLVYYQFFPNFWVFVLVLILIWLALAIFVYKVLLPVFYDFVNKQQWAHGNPFRAKLEEIDKKVDTLLEEK